MEPKKELRILALADLVVEAEVRAEGEAPKPVIRGYAAVYDSLSEDLGGFREKVAVGAFSRALKDGQDVVALVNHDDNLVLGRTSAGTLRLASNQKGLLATIDPPDTQASRDVQELIKRGDVQGMSFAFRVVRDEWDLKQTPPVRTVLDTDLFDVSVVTRPAYRETEVGMALRSLEDAKAAADVFPDPPAGLHERRQELAEMDG
jgi:HK97 family phage prohead protease